MSQELLHERLDVYKLYLDAASLCNGMTSSIAQPMTVLDHLERAMDSIGINLMRANTQAPRSPLRCSYLDVSIASTHECAASLDVCSARKAIEDGMCRTAMDKLWRIRGMLLGLKRVRADRVSEDPVTYGTPKFPFSALGMYQESLRVVRWTDGLLKELAPKTRTWRKLDSSTTGTVLNIAEGHGRATATDQNRFMKMAQEHAFQTVLAFDVLVARREATESRIAEGKATVAQVIAMLHSWCNANERRNGYA